MAKKEICVSYYTPRGTGKMVLNLDNILPATAKDFNQICDVINLSGARDDHARDLFEYIAEKVTELKDNPSKVIYIENKRTDKSALLAKYERNAAELSRRYGTPALVDEKAAETATPLKNAFVYAWLKHDNGEPYAARENGWTFSKGGFDFSVYQTGKAYYPILLNGTGLKVAYVTAKAKAREAITDKIIETLRKGSKKIDEYKAQFNLLMIEAGYAERAENISEISLEDIKMVDFDKNIITVKGVEFPAAYGITNAGEIIVFVTLEKSEDGRQRKQKLVIDRENEAFLPALAAASAYLKDILSDYEYRDYMSKIDGVVVTEAGKPVVIEEEPVTTVDDHSETVTETAPEATEEPETETAPETETTTEPEPEAETETEAEERRSTIPEKTFIGTEIKGNGWKILFDPETERTRIIFQEPPKKRALAIVKDARFFWSPVMKSWNKKLTFKAFRAAQEIAKKLDKIYGAAA